MLPKLQRDLDAHLLPELHSIVLGYLSPESLLTPPVLPAEPPQFVLSTRRLMAQLQPIAESNPMIAEVHAQLCVIDAQSQQALMDHAHAIRAAEAAVELRDAR